MRVWAGSLAAAAGILFLVWPLVLFRERPADGTIPRGLAGYTISGVLATLAWWAVLAAVVIIPPLIRRAGNRKERS